MSKGTVVVHEHKHHTCNCLLVLYTVFKGIVFFSVGFNQHMFYVMYTIWCLVGIFTHLLGASVTLGVSLGQNLQPCHAMPFYSFLKIISQRRVLQKACHIQGIIFNVLFSQTVRLTFDFLNLLYPFYRIDPFCKSRHKDLWVGVKWSLRGCIFFNNTPEQCWLGFTSRCRVIALSASW